MLLQILFIAAVLFSIFCSIFVQVTFAKYRNKRNVKGLTGQQVARIILDKNGLTDVPVYSGSGSLTDHFDPRDNSITLSESVYGSDSIGSVAVAAHEVGHAIQHARGYTPLVLRSAFAPVAQVASRAWVVVIVLGAVLSVMNFYLIGAVLFGIMLVFQLVTLPVEFDATGRALRTLSYDGYLNADEMKGARSVLSAAAMTYVSAAILTLIQLLRFLAVLNRR
ncbi:zinc metallopeptidase [Clostridia bacterium]|nr:zinc metallopeptidase [Clostridia bacterium]